MAISPAVLEQSGTDTDARDYSTGSLSPTAGKLYLAVIHYLDLGAARTDPTCSGWGLTWTSVNASGGGGTENALFVFRASSSTTPTAGAVTFSGTVSAGQTADGAQWCILEVAGVDIASTNEGVVQSAIASVAADAATATLAAFKQASSGTLAAIGSYDNAGGALDITEGSGFTMLTGSEASQAAGGDTLRMGIEYKTTNDTGVDATVSAANDRLVIVAMELAVPTEASSGTATGTGTGNSPTVALAPSSGTGTASGAAGGPTSTVSPTAGTASATGTANDVGGSASVSAGTATGTGTANDATGSVAPTAGEATATGVANDATTTLSAGTGTAGATGAAGGPTSTVAPVIGTATGTGAANDATAGLSAGTGTAGATGAAGGPTSTVSPVIGTASGVGTAYDATVTTLTATFGGSVTVSAWFDSVTVTADVPDDAQVGASYGTAGTTARHARAAVSSAHAGSSV